MKVNLNKQWMKVAGIALAIGTFSVTASAQNTTTAVANKTVATNSTVKTAPVANGAIRLIDNKGTIKYLQAQNGLTSITNVASDGTGVTTTWQLGGSLKDNTYINASGKVFALDSLVLITDATTASTDATTNSVHGTGTGFTVLIRDEATGAIQKIKLGDLLQVQAGQTVTTVTSAQATANTLAIALSTNTPTDNQKVSVYRNGAKLVGGTSGGDYTLASGSVTITPVSTYGEWALYAGDVIEVQWVK